MVICGRVCDPSTEKPAGRDRGGGGAFPARTGSAAVANGTKHESPPASRPAINSSTEHEFPPVAMRVSQALTTGELQAAHVVPRNVPLVFFSWWRS